MSKSSAGRGPNSDATGAVEKSVLVVDDDPDICRFITEALNEAGYTVNCARDGVSALQKVRGEPPDLILLDVHMPGIDGWDVLNQLRSAAGPQEPIVIMTGQYEGQERALASGAQGYLAKPFDLDDLVECVDLHANIQMTAGSDEEFPVHER